MSIPPPPNFHITRRINPILIQLNAIFKQPTQNNCKSKNCCSDLVNHEVISFFVASKGKEIQKIDGNS